jgi:CubicO group peptidase (beta-lactamase class C family)
MLHAALALGLVASRFEPAAAQKPDAFAGVPRAVRSFVESGDLSGAVMLVASKERVLHLSAVGASEVASGRKMQTNDLFWIASMSKPITAVAVALLVGDRKLAFDDPVEKYLPEFRDRWVVQEQASDRRVLEKAARPITVRDLLTHTSGMGEYTITDPHWTLAQMSQVVSREPLRFQPGTRWAYSTAAFDVLGRIVEVASGASFDAFLQRRLFDPLGMTSTTFWPTREQDRRLARTYDRDSASGRLVPTSIAYMYGGAITDRRRPPLGGAGLFSTAEDIAKFYQLMLNDGVSHGRRILSHESVAEMTRKQTGELRARAGMPWGLGFCIIEDPSQMRANATLSPGTFGHGGAHGTHGWADPKRGIVYVFMIQRGDLRPNPDDSPMRRAYQDAVAAALGLQRDVLGGRGGHRAGAPPADSLRAVAATGTAG